MFIDLLREIGKAISDKPKNIVKVVASVVLSVVNILSKLAYPYTFILTLEALSSSTIPVETALSLAGGYILLWSTGKVIPHFRRMLLHSIGTKMSHNLTNQVIRKSYALPLEYKISNTNAPALQHFGAAYENIGQTFISLLLGDTLPAGVEVVTGIIFLGVLYGYPALPLLGVFVLNVTFSIVTSGTIRNTQNEHTTKVFGAFEVLIEAFDQYENAHYFGQVDYERQKLLERMSHLSKAQATALNRRSLVSAFANIITGVTLTGTTIYIAFLTNNSALSINDFVWVTFYILITAESQTTFSDSLVKLRSVMSNYSELRQYLKKAEVEVVKRCDDFAEADELQNANVVINEESRLINPIQQGIEAKKQAEFMSKLLVVKDHEPTIEFDKVSFGYGEEMVFEELSFIIPANKLTIIVGLSGEGKSSIMKLILGFYKPSSGCIRLSGRDISMMDINEVRREIAIVPQYPVLFNDTLRNNLIYSNLNAGDHLLNEAIELAGLSELVNERTLDFEVGEKGGKLSGGQKQRVALARAIIKANTQFLILDEPTSSLDIDTETKVLNNLRGLLEEQKKTTLFITHKLTSLAQLGKVDKVIVINKGKPPEEGTIGKLMQKQGLFYQQIEIARKQVDETLKAGQTYRSDIEQVF